VSVLHPEPAIATPAGIALLPTPVARWLETAWLKRTDRLDTLALVGRARMRRGGIGARLPVRFRMTHVLGRHHVADMTVGIGPIALVRAMDAYIDGHGISRVGHTVEDGPEIDQGAFLFLWAEAFLYPAAWAHLPGLRWEGVNHHTALLDLPFEGGLERALVHFDPETAYPSMFEASRYKGTGARIPWRVDYADWGWSNGLPVPRRGAVQWDDEPAPWFEFRIDEALPEVPVTDELRHARDVLAGVMGTAPG
jgi:hypothetical protein